MTNHSLIFRFLLGEICRFFLFFWQLKHRPGKYSKVTRNYILFALIAASIQYLFKYLEYKITLFSLGDEAYSMSRISVWIGLLFLICGFCLRFRAINVFYKYTSVRSNETVDKKKVLIRNDVYKYFRHPNYLGMIVFLIGQELFIQNIIVAIITVSIAWKYYFEIIKEEETNLVAAFGNDYISYRNSTPSHIPYID